MCKRTKLEHRNGTHLASSIAVVLRIRFAVAKAEDCHFLPIHAKIPHLSIVNFIPPSPAALSIGTSVPGRRPNHKGIVFGERGRDATLDRIYFNGLRCNVGAELLRDQAGHLLRGTRRCPEEDADLVAHSKDDAGPLGTVGR